MKKHNFQKVIGLTLTAALSLSALFESAYVPAQAAENLAYGKSVTVSSVESDAYPGSNAVDANGNTRWASSYTDNQNFIVDLGTTYNVTSVKIAWEAAYASQYQIQVSNDKSTWTTVYSNWSGKGGTETLTFDAASARYVKLYCIKRATSYGFSLYEFEVYGTAATSTSTNTGNTSTGTTTTSGTNLAYGKTTAVSSVESSDHVGSYAVDGNGNTRWSSSYADNQNFAVDLGATYTISSVKIAWEAAYASQYQIQVSSDNSTWTTVYSNWNGKGGTETLTFDAVSARYVKVYCIKRATSYGFSLYEFEVYGSASTTTNSSTNTNTSSNTSTETTNTTTTTTSSNENLAYGKTATVSSTESSEHAASYALDGNGNTRWSSSYADNQNFIVDLGGTYNVSSVKIAWEAAYAAQYQVQVSSDNSTWTTVYSNWNCKGGTETLTFDTVSARYVKVYCIKRATSYGFSFYEFEVYGNGSSSSNTGNTSSGNTSNTSTGDTVATASSTFANLAYGKTVTATSTYSSSNPAANAVDGNGSTYWMSSYANEQNFTVDLGATYNIAKVKIKWGSAYASSFQIQTSTDGNTWTTQYSNYSGTCAAESLSFIPTNARYVKVYCINRATSQGFAITEFEVYQTNPVLAYMYNINGSYSISGIHNREPNSNPSKQTDSIYALTGDYPGLWSGDFLFSSDDVNNRWNMIYECEKQWNRGSIVQIMFHVTSPTKSETGNWDNDVCLNLSDSQWNDLITDGGSLNKTWKSRLDTYGSYLSYLQDKGVTVMVRPFHEMNQSLFWWAGRTGTNGTGALYRLTRNYLECNWGLNNLIWVWDMQDLDYNWANYNPGNNYWDIFAVDFYNGDGYTSKKYQTALDVAGNKLIAIGECDTLPTASELQNQRWVFFMSWAELTFSYNSNSKIQNLYWAGNVLVQDELPSFK